MLKGQGTFRCIQRIFVIYIAGTGDTLWDIGKKYYVSIAQLKEVNELVSEESMKCLKGRELFVAYSVFCPLVQR